MPGFLCCYGVAMIRVIDCCGVAVLLVATACTVNVDTLVKIEPSLTLPIPTAKLTALQVQCAQAQPVLTVATQPTLPAPLVETAAPAAALCDQLLAGEIPPTLDTGTASWLSRIVAALPRIAEAAGVLLPLLRQ